MELLISLESPDPHLCARRSDRFIHSPSAVPAAPGKCDRPSVGSTLAKQPPHTHTAGVRDRCPSQRQEDKLVFPPLTESGSDRHMLGTGGLPAAPPPCS